MTPQPHRATAPVRVARDDELAASVAFTNAHARKHGDQGGRVRVLAGRWALRLRPDARRDTRPMGTLPAHRSAVAGIGTPDEPHAADLARMRRGGEGTADGA